MTTPERISQTYYATTAFGYLGAQASFDECLSKEGQTEMSTNGIFTAFPLAAK